MYPNNSTPNQQSYTQFSPYGNQPFYQQNSGVTYPPGSATPVYPQTQRPNYFQNSPMPNQQMTAQQGELLGRVVDSEDDIVYAEIPQNGSIGLFPKKDLTCIYAKQVDNNGYTTTIKYVPEQADNQSNQQSNGQGNVLTNILDRLDEIEGMLKNQRKPYRKPYKKNQNGSNYQKKEVNNG